MRVKDGKKVEHWFVEDTMSMMQQLGLQGVVFSDRFRS